MIKCDIKVTKIMFPKNKLVESGEFAIFAGEVVAHKEGDMPILNKTYKTVSLKGNVPCIKVGGIYTIKFDNPQTNEYGTTYTVTSIIKEIDPNNKKELQDYLKLMCGPQIAKELLLLKNPYELLLQRNDNELLKVKGIGKAKLEAIYKKIDSFADNSFAYVKLEPLGLTRKQIKNICFYTNGPASAVDVCMNNPYSLINKVKGIGFKLADEIAMKCGIDPFNPIRIKSALNYILTTEGEQGKSFLYAAQLLDEIKKIINIEFYLLDKYVRQMISEGELCVSEDGMKVALPYYVNLEKEIAKEVRRIMDAGSKIKIPSNWRSVVDKIEQRQGWCHTEEQMQGIQMSLENNLLIVSGKAGSGKSTITNAMVEILNDYDVALCCLSAKAAQRLKEVTGMNASTIHRLLGIGSSEENEILADIIIIDEASMISGTIFLKLLKAIKDGAKVIILGDDGQLTAIGNCAIFADLMVSKSVPHIKLTKIHRQAEKSAIITKSIDIRNQVPICKRGFKGHMIMGELQDLELFVLDSELLLDQTKKEFMKQLNETGDVLEVQIITAVRSRGSLCMDLINKEIQSLVNPKKGISFKGRNDVEIFEGDKVINLKNNYNTKNPVGMPKPVWNGSIGIVEKITKEGAIINFCNTGRVLIESKDYSVINLAYAITTHSSQGSQWEKVIGAFDIGAYKLLNVELLYTSITRAAKHCTIIIDESSLFYATTNVEQKTKQTLLSYFMNEH